MKKVLPFVIAAVLIAGVYYLWSTYGITGSSNRIKSLYASANSAEKPSDWHDIDRSAEGFRVKMPSEPRPSVAMANNESGSTEPVQMLVASGSNTATTYAIAWEDNPPVERVNGQVPDRTLDMARDGATARTQTTLISEDRISPQGFPGREFVARNVGGGYLETRFVLAGTRLFMLLAASPSVTARHEQEVQRFFNSFTLASDGKLPTALPAATQQ
jgi:hypothetical protein